MRTDVTHTVHLVIVVFLQLCTALAATGGTRFCRHVDPFIGTANGGNTFPGALRPWGMVAVSPHNDLHSPSGYIAGRPWFYGLGQVHLSGTGCADLGSIIVSATAGDATGEPERYRSTLIDEHASPGFWEGTLVEPSVHVEASATVRSGIMRFVRAKKGAWTLLIDAGRSLSMVGGGAVRWRSSCEVEGFNIGGGFCGEDNRHIVYFSALLSRRPSQLGIWRDSTVSTDSAAHIDNAAVGAWARFGDNREGAVEVRVGISYVSIANARLNRKAEADGKSFTSIRAAAESAWEDALGRVRVSGGAPGELTKFYTALYHTLIHPSIISDANGEYPLLGRQGTGRNTTRVRYSVFSLWDTYRTLHPLLTLVYPERQSEVVSTMLDMYKESGWLPKWELGGNDTHLMVGDGAVPVIADTYLKGIRDFDTTAAFEAMRKPGTVFTPDAEPSRPGYADYVKLGYIPFDQDTSRPWWVWGPVSTTLEYCLADWTFARVSAARGQRADAEEFARRSMFYRNLFDTATCFLRPRRGNGGWLTPFDPLQTEGSGSWSGSGGPGYVEGNAWQYTWFVPHDIAGLAGLFGGTDKCAEKLAQCFSNAQFTINNEPDIAYPYLFTYFPGHEQETARLVRNIMEKNFSTGPSGLPGNDDAGTISAWYVFSALGFYPDCPGSGEYRIGLPAFSEAKVLLNRRYYTGASIVIRRTPAEGSGKHVQEVRWNGERREGYSIGHGELGEGGELRFTVGP